MNLCVDKQFNKKQHCWYYVLCFSLRKTKEMCVPVWILMHCIYFCRAFPATFPNFLIELGLKSKYCRSTSLTSVMWHRDAVTPYIFGRTYCLFLRGRYENFINTKLHGVISQKTVILTFTAVSISDFPGPSVEPWCSWKCFDLRVTSWFTNVATFWIMTLV